MQDSGYSLKIIAALIVAAAMIGVSYWLSSGAPRLASALSTDELLRAYVAQDTDDDGLPDWKETAYGTDPGNPMSVSPGMTDGEAVAAGLVAPAFVPEKAPEPISSEEIPTPEPASGSLTERFSRQFAQVYFASGSNISDVQEQQLIENLLTTFTKEAGQLVESPYSVVSVRKDSRISLDAYASSLMTTLFTYDVPPNTPDLTDLAKTYIEIEDASARETVARIYDSYAAITRELLAMSVPQEVADAHLTLLRSFDSLARTSSLLLSYEEDPIAALGAMSAIQPSSAGILDGFKKISVLITASGEPESGTAAAQIVRIAREAEQQP